jgi:hypothetical protein
MRIMALLLHAFDEASMVREPIPAISSKRVISSAPPVRAREFGPVRE